MLDHLGTRKGVGDPGRMTASPAPELGERTSTFNYLAAFAQSSLYRNGKVLTRRDLEGSDSGTEGIEIDEREVAIRDARWLEGELA